MTSQSTVSLEQTANVNTAFGRQRAPAWSRTVPQQWLAARTIVGKPKLQVMEAQVRAIENAGTGK